MPNLVVYVPAKLWKRIEEEMGAEWPTWARQVTVKAIEDFVNGTPTASIVVSGGVKKDPVITQADAQPRDIPARSVTPSADTHFKPDFGKKLKQMWAIGIFLGGIFVGYGICLFVNWRHIP